MKETVTKLKSHHLSAILPLAEGQALLPVEQLLAMLKDSIVQAGLTVVADVVATFPGQGASAVAVLEESHVAIHLWPEHKLATVDIHVCDYSGNNEAKAKHLAQLIGQHLSGSSSLDKWSQLTLSV